LETGKKHFFLKLNSPRPSFQNDMDSGERIVMQQHVEYWKPYVENGVVVVLGPVFDPKGGFGIATVEIDSEEHLHEVIAKDPANGLCSYEVYPMRAVKK
jgi:uncharacterized protein